MEAAATAATAAKSTSRQLAARRRREPRGQRQGELLFSRMPDHKFTIAVVRSSGPAPGGQRVSGNRPAVRSWTSAVKPLPPAPPPRPPRMPSGKALGQSSFCTFRGQETPFPPTQWNRSRNRSRSQSRSRTVEQPVSAAPARSRRWRSIPVKAKVDSHWLKPQQHQQHQESHILPSPGLGPNPGMRKLKTSKSLAEAHEELEQMLSRIERARDFLPPPPPPPTPTISSKRGSLPMVTARGGSKVTKGVSRHRAQPPPAPPGSPMNSARRGSASVASEPHLPPAVPLAHNPQCLVPAKRDALLELLQRTEQHDRGILDMVRGAQSGELSARDSERMKLPLSLNESPYSGRGWQVCSYDSGSLKDHLELYPQTEGQLLMSHLRDGKQASLMMHMEEKIRQLNDRQEQAMRERAELEQDKMLVTICREQRCEREKMKQLKKQQKSNDKEVTEPLTTIYLKDPLATSPIPVPFDPWQELLQERERFQGQCQRSYFYNNSRCPAPWKIYARVASKLSSTLMDILQDKFKQPSKG